ncbi:MAG: hypothetical protein EU529_13295 [Promethearchaeota archaeon]|nr:MAG: hypothetical protein EU529_13295 [Candidatus Lokiarchaeota archaeon]
MLKKLYHQNWIFECPDAVMTCSILKCNEEAFLIFGGHDKTLYLMDNDLRIYDKVSFDGWCRCTYPIDLDGDKCDEVLVGTGDGHFVVLKLTMPTSGCETSENTMKLEGIMNYKLSGMVNCCAAGDLSGDNNIELMFGGEDKTVRVFKNVFSEKPFLTFYYDSWVTACCFGYLKIPEFDKPVASLLVGTRNGLLQLIHMKNDNPEILWQQNVYAEINDIKIGDITNDGLNEIIVASDDSYVKIYDSKGKRIKFIFIEEVIKGQKKNPKRLNRPKSLLIEDIDGDKANEIVVGCADGTLRIFHNIKLNSKDIELKWKTTTKLSASIKNICACMNKQQKVKNIIYGGYERTIRNISDFEWGKKPLLKIPIKFRIPQVSIKEQSNQSEEILKIKKVPTNLRGFIKELLDKQGFYMTLDLLISDLMDKGYTRKEINEELEFLKSKGAMCYEKVDIDAWSLVNELIDELIKTEANTSKKPHKIEEGTTEKSEEPEASTSDKTEEIDKIIINILNEQKIIPTKEELVSSVASKGYNKDAINQRINAFKNKNKIKFSRSDPRGWSIVD